MKHGAAGGWNLGTFSYKVEIPSAELISAAESAQAETLQNLGDYIREESTAIAPLRQGGLIASSYVHPGGEKVEIGYNIIYAHYQHEGTHFFHPNGRQAKYLSKIMEDPNTLAQAQAMFAASLTKRIPFK